MSAREWKSGKLKIKKASNGGGNIRKTSNTHIKIGVTALIMILCISIYMPIAAFAGSFIRLNYEGVSARNFTVNQIDAMAAIRETLMTAYFILPVKVNQLHGQRGFDSQQFYETLLRKSTSNEAFNMILDFMTAEQGDSGIHIALQNLFMNNSTEGMYVTRNGTRFTVDLIWLYPTNDGLAYTKQENMTETDVERVLYHRMLFPIFEVRYFLPERVNFRTAFFQRGLDIIAEKFPSSYISDADSDNNMRLIHLIFPDVTQISEIILRSVEYAGSN